MRHHAFVIEAEAEKGIEIARVWVKRELGMEVVGNPDCIILRYGLFTVADARKIAELASGVAFAGTSKTIFIAASRAYHEAQNALLKIFEEPPAGTYLFLILPSLGGLLPTLRSRVQVLSGQSSDNLKTKPEIRVDVRDFICGTAEKRAALIKRLSSGKDGDEKRERRDEAIALINGLEEVAYAMFKERDDGEAVVALLSDISTMRPYLYDRSSPVKMILEHLALVLPKDLL